MFMNYLPFFMFMLSMLGLILNSSNMMLILMFMEILLLSMSMNFLFHSLLLKSMLGQIYSIYIISMAAVESAMGLSMIISFYKLKGSMSMKYLNLLKG